MFGCWVKFLGRFEVLGINGYLGQQIESQLYADQEAFPSDCRISICSEMRVGKSRCPCGSSRGQAELEVTTRARGERCREAPVAHRSIRLCQEGLQAPRERRPAKNQRNKNKLFQQVEIFLPRLIL